MTEDAHDVTENKPTLSRRRFLASTVGGVGFAQAAPSGPAQTQNRITRRVMIPAVEAFENQYLGQFLYVGGPAEDAEADVPLGRCGFQDWSPENPRVYEGQLLDRRQEEPIAVDLHVYDNDGAARIQEASHFIIQNTVSCPQDFIGLELEWVPRRALAGKPPGPTVAETDAGGQPGFGPLVALLGLGIGVTVRELARRYLGDRS